MVERYPDWPNRLSAYLSEKQNEVFQWGVNDCLLFVAKGVERLTGLDFYTEYGEYSTDVEAYNVLSENGGVRTIINRALGANSKNVLNAKRGDVVIVKVPEIIAGLVDDSGQRIAFVTSNGLTRTPLDKALRFWSY